MNILYILGEQDSYDAVSDTLDLLKSLNTFGHNCVLAGTLNSEMLNSDDLGGKYYQLPYYERNFLNIPLAYRELKEIVKAKNIDVIHTSSALNNWLGLFVSRNADIPLISSCYQFIPENFFNLSFVLSNKIIVRNKALGKYLVNQFKLESEHIQFIDQGLNLEEIASNNINQQSKTDFKIGIIVSYLDKGYKYFFKSIPIALRNFPYIKIYILSNSPCIREEFKEELEVFVEKIGLDGSVEFIDNFNLAGKILPQLNILISNPIVEDAQAKLLIQAQACGSAVIASRVNGLEEVVLDNKTGLLISPRDPKALAGAIISILGDPQLNKVITVSARRKIEEENDFNKIIKAYDLIYKQAIDCKCILTVNISRVQDVILSIAASKILKNQNPNIKIISLVASHLRCLIAHSPYIDEVIVYDYIRKAGGWLGFIAVIRLLIQKRFDIAIDFTNTIKTRILAYFSLSRRRFYNYLLIKNLNANKREYSRKLALPVNLQGRNSREFALKDIFFLKDKIELCPAPEDIKFIDNFLNEYWVGRAKLAVIDVSTDKKRFQGYLPFLCDKLAGLRIRAILTGLKDTSNVSELFKKINSKPILAKKEMSVMQLACLIERSNLFVGFNSEPLCLAAATKTPSLILTTKRNKNRFPPEENIEVLSIGDFLRPKKARFKRVREFEINKEVIMKKINKLLKNN